MIRLWLFTKAVRAIVSWAWHVVRDLAGFMVLVIVAFWRNVPASSSSMAHLWWSNAMDAGFPPEWDRALYDVLWAVAFVILVVGWILCSYLTVTIFRLIF